MTNHPAVWPAAAGLQQQWRWQQSQGGVGRVRVRVSQRQPVQRASASAHVDPPPSKRDKLVRKNQTNHSRVFPEKQTRKAKNDEPKVGWRRETHGMGGRCAHPGGGTAPPARGCAHRAVPTGWWDHCRVHSTPTHRRSMHIVPASPCRPAKTAAKGANTTSTSTSTSGAPGQCHGGSPVCCHGCSVLRRDHSCSGATPPPPRPGWAEYVNPWNPTGGARVGEGRVERRGRYQPREGGHCTQAGSTRRGALACGCPPRPRPRPC